MHDDSMIVPAAPSEGARRISDPASAQARWEPVVKRLRATWPGILILLLAAPSFWPFYKLGLLAATDIPLHLLRTAILDFNLRHGMLYTRWVPQLALGYGFPVFNYYPPATYYLAEALHLLGLALPTALMALFGIFVGAAGIGMFFFARDVIGEKGSWPAVVAAVAYVYAPYLLTNIFIRGALAEVGAQALLPWILWSARRLLLSGNPRTYVLPLVLTLGGLAVTHSLSLVIVPPVLLGYLAALWWAHRRRGIAWPWLAISLLLAMGMSCVVWLPLVAGRGDLTRNAYEAAAKILPINAYDWRNLINAHLQFSYNLYSPFQIGAVQALLAILGLFLAARRDLEWWYWAVVSAALLIFASKLALPVWAHSDVLLAIQFPWRLLSIVGLGLALFTGGILRCVREGMWRRLAGALILSIILAANWPTSMPQPALTVEEDPLPPTVARFEAKSGHYGATSAWSKEFFPRWVDLTSGLTLKAEPGQSEEPDVTLALKSAGELGLEFEVTSERGGPLRLTTFFFPGWQALMDGQVRLAAYPSTNLGLLTVDVPSGIHRVQVRWAGTLVQRVATGLSLISLIGLAGLYWRLRRRRLMIIPASLLVIGLAAAVWPAPAAQVTLPQQQLGSAGLRLLGYRSEQVSRSHLYIYPYWWVINAQPKTLRMHWQLRDAAGRIVTEIRALPYFGSVPASNWPARTLVDDAYELALPPGLAAGTYQLFGEVQAPERQSAGVTAVGPVDVTEPAPVRDAADPDHPLDLRVGEGVLLRGYDLRVNGRRIGDETHRPTVARPGDTVEYTLYWRALGELSDDYHGLVHLLDYQQRPLVQEDHAVGEPFQPTSTWDHFYTMKDRYRLDIPKDAGSGLYWPKIALYNFDALAQLPFYAADGHALGDSYPLPPVKVLGTVTSKPQQALEARLGEVGALWGYDLALPPQGLRPGSSFDLILYYRCSKPTAQDYTRFVHLYAPELGMAAQQDSEPGAGNNPTSSWVPGEVIVERVHLTVDPAAKPGMYALQVGLYELENGRRLAVWDRAGNRLADDQATLIQLQVD